MTSTLASHKRSINSVQAQAGDVSSDSDTLALSTDQGQSKGSLLPPPPISPIQTSFPLLPGEECPSVTAARSPGSIRQRSVISCPDPRDCAASRTPSIPIFQPTNQAFQQDHFQTLSWDNYSETPDFLGRTYLLRSPRTSPLASSTDPFHLDDSGSLSDFQLDLERLRSDTEDIHKVQLVSTDCSDLPEYSPTLVSFPNLLGAENFAQESFGNYSDQVVTMDSVEAENLRKLGQELEDELNDLVAADITRGQALHIESDLDRIWKLKNELRNKVRYLVT